MFVKQRQETLERYRILAVKVDDYHRSVYTTWYMSYELLSIEARQLLHLMAFMHHTGIAENIFQRATMHLQTYEPATPATGAEAEARVYITKCLRSYLDMDGAWDSGAFLATMTELLSYSIVTYDNVNSTYTLHVLVHDWASTVVDHPMDVAVEHTALLLAVSIDYDDTTESLAYKRMVEVHVDKVLERGAQPSANNAAPFAEVYRGTGKWKQQERMEQIVLDGRRRALGEEHDGTLISMNNLALAYRLKGRYEQAATLFAQVLEIRKRVSGDIHPHTLTAMQNLAGTYNYLGRYSQAESLQLQAMEARKRLHGDEDTHTLWSMHDLAFTYKSQGRYKEAEALSLQVVEGRKRVSGDEHPETLTAISGLASTYYYQDRYEEAELLHMQVLELRKRRFGNDHPDTLASMHNLSFTYTSQERYNEAEILIMQVLSARKRLFGEEHVDTLRAMHCLAYIYQQQGRYEQAEELQVRVIAGQKYMLGVQHPTTLHSMDHLLATYATMGIKGKKYKVLQQEIQEIEQARTS